jgi:hypothetical protein
LFYCLDTCVDGGLYSFLLFIGVIIRHFSKVVLCYEFIYFLFVSVWNPLSSHHMTIHANAHTGVVYVFLSLSLSFMLSSNVSPRASSCLVASDRRKHGPLYRLAHWLVRWMSTVTRSWRRCLRYAFKENGNVLPCLF